MFRKELFKQLKPVWEKHQAVVIGNIGHPSQELYQLGDAPYYFYMLGSMGLASSIGLGIARCVKDPVLAIDGDGSVLMNLGTLVTIAHQAPANYVLLIVDNGSYGSTGHQPTYTRGEKTSLAELARAAGIKDVRTPSASEAAQELELALTAAHPVVMVVKVQPGADNLPVIPLDPGYIKERFQRNLHLLK